MSVVEEEITLPVVKFKRQTKVYKVYLRRIVMETLDPDSECIYSSRKPKIQSYGFTLCYCR